CARLLAYQARMLLEQAQPDFGQASSLLLEAESYLIGRKLWDIEVLVQDLRRRIGPSPRAAVPSRAPPALHPSAASLELLRSLKESLGSLRRRLEAELGGEKASFLWREVGGLEERLLEAQRGLEGRDPRAFPPVNAGSLVGRSPAIRRLTGLIRQLGP